MNEKICPICQSRIPENAPGGLCPACVLRDADEPPAPRHEAPSIDEIAVAFPQLEVVSLVGQGGMGFVYTARQPGLDRVVALKILSPELGRDPAFSERFAREARTLGKLHHPNIVTLFEHGESGGFFYLLMEYVDGVNLRQAMRAGRFTPEQALAIVPGICDALQFAHEQGVWHRDIKPENILLDARGNVKMADFGIARIVGDPRRDFTLTMTGNALGSAAYMAPEQHENPRDVDHRADIYSLGVVIYEMLTGELPLGRFPSPSRRAAVSARIDEIVLRTLEKERELRQQSANEVKTDLQGATTAAEPAKKSGAPESASPLTRLPRLVLWSLGLLVGGAALWVATSVVESNIARNIDAQHWSSSAVLSGDFSSSLKAMAVAMLVLRSIAGLACALGFLGSLWALYEMKRGWMPAVGRWLLIALTIGPLTCAPIGVAWAYLFTTTELQNRKGELHLMMAGTFGALGIVFGILFLLARPLQPASPNRRRLGNTCLTLAAIATVACAVLTKRFDYHWPQLFYGERATLKLLSPNRPPDDQLLALLKKAAGPFAGDYKLAVSNGVASVVAVTRERSSGDRPDPLSAHSNNCLFRLLDLLPANAITPREIDVFDPSGFVRPEWRRQADPRYLPRHVTIAVLAVLGALLGALAGGRRAVWVIAGGVVLHLVLAALPVWPTTDRMPPRVVDAPPLPPDITADEMSAPDFSTPEKAVMSVYDARCFGRLDVVKRGVSKGLATEIEALSGGWEGYMSRYPDQGFAAEESYKMGGLTYVRGNFVVRRGRDQAQAQNPWPRVAIFEDGEWKLDNLDLANDLKSPEISAEKIFQRMNAFSNEWNSREFMKLVTSELKGCFDPILTPDLAMAPFRGKIQMAKPLGGGKRGEHLKSKVIACIGGRDGSTYTTFTFANQGGNWLLTRWDKSIYRARCRIFYYPPKADGESILRSHLGNTQLGDVRGPEFDILGDDLDADTAVRKANEAAAKLQASLKKDGLDASFRILKPAEKPDKPWMGEDDLEPEEPTASMLVTPKPAGAAPSIELKTVAKEEGSEPTIEASLNELEEYMTSQGPQLKSQYRAVCRVEVRLTKGNTEALLNEALGKFCTVIPVPGVQDQFDLVVTDPDPAQTSRFANYLGQNAEELLKEREVQGTVKVLKPAERPETPASSPSSPR